MQIVNKTPHVLNVHLADGSVRNIAPTLPAARVESRREALPEIDGVPVTAVRYGAVVDLPDPQDGVFFVVSALVAGTPEARRRTDVLIVGEPVRDPDGKIVGCKGLSFA